MNLKSPTLNVTFCTDNDLHADEIKTIQKVPLVLYIYKDICWLSFEGSPEICKHDSSRSCEVLEFCSSFPFSIKDFFSLI